MAPLCFGVAKVNIFLKSQRKIVPNQKANITEKQKPLPLTVSFTTFAD